MEFLAYYLLMCLLGVVVIVATLMRNRASSVRRCKIWNRIAFATWHIGAILFVVYLYDYFIAT